MRLATANAAILAPLPRQRGLHREPSEPQACATSQSLTLRALSLRSRFFGQMT
ncbi:hypothetical protein MJ8_28330 [Mesorhizobium sp. J8]|nr:hypothetical protein MJ8_28330 [Mesorhizobium sp. J8]